MPSVITQAQITNTARQIIGNKITVSVGEDTISDATLAAAMREQVMECCRMFGGSSAKKEAGFTTIAAPPLSAPASLVATPSASGGSLASGTYAYEVSSIRGNGECLPGGAQVVTVTGPTGSVALSWPAVQGAEGYRIYGRTQGFYQRLAEVTITSWTDTGIALPGSGPPTNNGVSGAYQQNYDVATYIGTDVLEIDEVLRSDAYRSDALVDYYMVDPRTGIPAVKGAFVDQGFQQMALESQQQIERFSNADKFEWETYTDGQGRLMLRLMPPPEQPIYVQVRYLSTNEGLGSLPEAARIPLEHAACTALLNCVMNRTNSEPPEAGQNYRERRIALDTIKGQRDYYEARYRRALARLAPNAR